MTETHIDSVFHSLCFRSAKDVTISYTRLLWDLIIVTGDMQNDNSLDSDFIREHIDTRLVA